MCGSAGSQGKTFKFATGSRAVVSWGESWVASRNERSKGFKPPEHQTKSRRQFRLHRERDEAGWQGGEKEESIQSSILIYDVFGMEEMKG